MKLWFDADEDVFVILLKKYNDSFTAQELTRISKTLFWNLMYWSKTRSGAPHFGVYIGGSIQNQHFKLIRNQEY
jgi:hypothetical protein